MKTELRLKYAAGLYPVKTSLFLFHLSFSASSFFFCFFFKDSYGYDLQKAKTSNFLPIYAPIYLAQRKLSSVLNLVFTPRTLSGVKEGSRVGETPDWQTRDLFLLPTDDDERVLTLWRCPVESRRARAARSWLVTALKRDVRGVCLSFGRVVSTPFSPVARFAH